MKRSLISIIVPVYNAEKTISKCIESIKGQIYIDWELLLVDDGSKDSSLRICNEYASKDERIKVFHKENGGVSSARNMGLDNAQGNWVMFVDSDDWITDDGLHIDFSLLKEDIILFSYYNNKNENNELIIPMSSDCVINSPIKLKQIYCSYLHNGIFKTIWSKLFRRNLIDDLRFDELIPIGEDHLFLLEYLARVKTLRFISKPLYVYSLSGPLFEKYQIKIDKSIYILMSIFFAYRKLEVCNINFEMDIFHDYKSFCQQEIYKNPRLWYGNYNIKSLYKRLKNKLGYLFRIKYKIMSIPLFSKLRCFFR